MLDSPFFFTFVNNALLSIIVVTVNAAYLLDPRYPLRTVAKLPGMMLLFLIIWAPVTAQEVIWTDGGYSALTALLIIIGIFSGIVHWIWRYGNGDDAGIFGDRLLRDEAIRQAKRNEASRRERARMARESDEDRERLRTAHDQLQRDEARKILGYDEENNWRESER